MRNSIKRYNTRAILSAKKDVEDKEGKLRETLSYIEDLELGKKDTVAYIAAKTKKRADIRKKRTLAVLILDSCYYDVCGLTPRKYWGGRTYVFRDALALMEHWQEIEEKFISKLEEVTDGQYAPYVERCKEAMKKTSAVMKHLYEAAKMSKSQKVMNEERCERFKELCINIGKEYRKQYPNRKVWWKLHTTETHLWRVARFWGLLGIASEEGFESAHVILNRIDKTLGQMKDREKKIRAHRGRMSMRRDRKVKEHRDTFKESGRKINNRKSPAIGLTGGGEETNLQQYDEVMEVRNDGANIVRCSWCKRRCPKVAIEFHVMASHMCGDISLAALGDELLDREDAEGAEGHADQQPQEIVQ